MISTTPSYQHSQQQLQQQQAQRQPTATTTTAGAIATAATATAFDFFYWHANLSSYSVIRLKDESNHLVAGFFRRFPWDKWSREPMTKGIVPVLSSSIIKC